MPSSSTKRQKRKDLNDENERLNVQVAALRSELEEERASHARTKKNHERAIGEKEKHQEHANRLEMLLKQHGLYIDLRQYQSFWHKVVEEDFKALDPDDNDLQQKKGLKAISEYIMSQSELIEKFKSQFKFSPSLDMFDLGVSTSVPGNIHCHPYLRKIRIRELADFQNIVLADCMTLEAVDKVKMAEYLVSEDMIRKVMIKQEEDQAERADKTHLPRNQRRKKNREASLEFVESSTEATPQEGSKPKRKRTPQSSNCNLKKMSSSTFLKQQKTPHSASHNTQSSSEKKMPPPSQEKTPHSASRRTSASTFLRKPRGSGVASGRRTPLVTSAPRSGRPPLPTSTGNTNRDSATRMSSAQRAAASGSREATASGLKRSASPNLQSEDPLDFLAKHCSKKPKTK